MNKLWLLQIPIILLFTLLFSIDERNAQGRIEDRFLRETVGIQLRNISTIFTDLKFRSRGPQPPKNKIVIVEIDNHSVKHPDLGRWPWHRDIIAALTENLFVLGAKVVGLDVVLSERDHRVPSELRSKLASIRSQVNPDEYETDFVMAQTVKAVSPGLVLGWASGGHIQPLYHDIEEVPESIKRESAFPEHFTSRFSFTNFRGSASYDPARSPFFSVIDLISNLKMYNELATHAGYFQAFPDPDGTIRRAPLFMMVGGRPYPALALAMARAGRGDHLELELDQGRVRRLGFMQSKKGIPVTPLGVMEINFRGGEGSFEYVSAFDVLLSDAMEFTHLQDRKIAALPREEALRKTFEDAYVLIGVTATALHDWRQFPFDSNVPGVEGHANILDNILAGDALTPASVGSGSWIVLALMIAGAGAFAFILQRLEAAPALMLSVIAFAGIGAADVKILFENNYNWNTGFLYLEMFALFFVTLAAKYLIEEQNKKFVRGAFAKYVSPIVVDSIMKDPKKLSLGGEKRELTILFSDIRSFTTFSEAMDARQLAHFLQDYLGIMTDIIVDNEGTLDKYIGDAIMAFWGAPLDQPRHAAQAAKAASEMLRAVTANQARWKSEFGIDVNVGTGLNSGIVSVGNMGSKTNFAYTAIGDHVNLASRLEGLTKYYGVGVLTSRFSLDCIAAAGSALPAHRVLDHVKVKGKKLPVEIVQVLEREHSTEGLRVFDDARKRYVGCDWTGAIELFGQANERLGGADGPCQLYLGRCRDFVAAPPGAGWDGSWEMDSK